MTREAMLERMMASDASYNGRFYTGVHSTGIYCLPSCRARKPKPENVRFYRSPDEARAAGLRPCKKCRPDDWANGLDVDLDRLRNAIDGMRENPSAFPTVDALAEAAMMSTSALYAAVRACYQRTPASLLVEARVQAACRLLRERQESVSEVGADVGFDSTSAYYENFRRLTGLTPAQYRRLADGMPFRLELPEDYHVPTFLRAFGRDAQSVTERVQGSRLFFTVEQAVASVEVSKGEASVTIEGSADPYEVHRQIVRMLGLSQNPRAFEESLEAQGLAGLIEGRRGLRIPQTPTVFDGLVWSIVGQQVNLPFAYAMRRRLAERFGTPVGDLYAAPSAHRVAELTVEDLAPLQFSRRKAEYLIGAAREVAGGTLNLDSLANEPATLAERRLRELRGIGPWSANYLMMRSLAFRDCLPLGDTGLTTALARFFEVPRPGPEQTTELMERFRPFRSLATFHLWQTLSSVEVPE